MMNVDGALLNSGDVVSGRVVEMKPLYATMSVMGQCMPLTTSHICWDVLRNPNERLSLGDRLEMAVCPAMTFRDMRKMDYPTPIVSNGGIWLSRLPLIENPWPKLQQRYQDGAVVEVECIDYLNWYVARVRLPEGLIIELRTNDIHPRSRRSVEYGRKFQPGERFLIVFRKISSTRVWVERFFGGSKSHDLAESGFLTPERGSWLMDAHERAFLSARANR